MKLFDISSPGANPETLIPEDGRIVLGETGRGRSQVIVPVTGHPYRGEYRAQRTEEGIVLVRGDFPPEERSLWRINTTGEYSRSRSYGLRDATGVTTLARGVFAFGDAGKTGSGDDILAILEPGAEFRLRSKYASHWYRWDGRVWTLLTPEERQAELALAASLHNEGEWL